MLEITEQELEQADRYEVDDYERISVTLTSGEQAWAYVGKQQAPPYDSLSSSLRTRSSG